MARPRSYDDDLRVRLIEAAARLLAEEGPHAVSTRRVAAEVGTSTTAIYSLIGSKDELIRAMFREGFERLAAALAAVELTDDPLQDLHDLGVAYHDMAVENPHLYRLMMDCPIPEFEPTAADVELSAGTLTVLVDNVQRCIDAGHYVGDAYAISMQAWALVHGFAMLERTGPFGSPSSARALLEEAMAVQAAGLRAQRNAALSA